MRKIFKTLAACWLLALPASALGQSFSQVQWGMDKSSNPYPVATNIAGNWRSFGTVSSTGEWRLSPKSVAATDFIRNDSTNPSISLPWLPDTTNGHVWTSNYFGTVASHNDDADSGGIVSFLSSTGYSAAPYVNWKAGWQVFATGTDGTSNIWGFNPTCGLTADESHGVGCVAVEADLNLYNRDYTGIPASAAGPWAAAVVAAGGGGGHYGHAAFVVNTASTPTWNFGILFTDYSSGGSKGINTADIRSVTKAPYFAFDSGTHDYGLALTGSYAGFAIGIPNNTSFSARNAANTAYENMFYLDPGNRMVIHPDLILQGSLQYAAYTVTTLPTCNASLNGHVALVTNGEDFNGYGLAGGYGSAVAAGLVTRNVLCTNRAAPLTFGWVYN